MFLHPPLIQIEPTTRCNLSCAYCTRKEPKRDISLETLRIILDRHKDIRNIKLQGLGEPFLHPNFTEVASLCKAHHPKSYVYTISNGTCINYDALEFIDRVLFSIDSLDEEKFKLTRPGVDFGMLLSEIHGLADMNKAGINQVITANTTREDLEDMHDFCKRFGLTLSQVRIENWGTTPDPFVQKERDINGIVQRRVFKCMWGITMYYYDALGRLHPCCIRMNDEYVVDDIDKFLCKRLYDPICMRCPD